MCFVLSKVKDFVFCTVILQEVRQSNKLISRLVHIVNWIGDHLRILQRRCL